MAYSPLMPFSEYLQEEQIKYPQLKLEDIRTLKDSLADDDKLPPISDKKYLAFLHSCNFDVELAKKTIEKCYKFHFSLPQVFCELDPFAEEIERNYQCVSLGQMPTINLDKNQRILYMQFIDYNHDGFDYVSLYKYLVMWMEHTLLAYGTCDGITTVVDTKGLSWRHVIKLPLGVSIKMLRFLETGLPVRVKQIHVLNTGQYTQMLLKLVMKFAGQELIDKIKVHSAGSEEVFNYVPRKIMPVEMGGLGKSHKEYNDQLYNDLKDIGDYFLEHNETMANQMSYLNQSHFEDNE